MWNREHTWQMAEKLIDLKLNNALKRTQKKKSPLTTRSAKFGCVVDGRKKEHKAMFYIRLDSTTNN